MNIRKAKDADAQGIAKVQVDSWKTTYKGIVSDSFLQKMSYKNLENKWKQIIDLSGNRNCTLVAENQDGVIVGFVSGGRERSGDYPDFQAELYAIYLFEKAQGQGLGRRLFVRLAEELSASGLASIMVWVLAENHPAKAFYESLNPEWVDSQPIEIGGGNHEEVAYGWRDIHGVIGWSLKSMG
ncbi:MAG TPA: GNAT family N-acetyltransferase [Bacillales bacterium]|nr:GNAT family N-acetyltransferase [Bacillales bacterium]